MNIKWHLMGICICSFLLSVLWTEAQETKAPVRQWLQGAGAVMFSHQQDVSPILQDVYIGYDAEDHIVLGIAGRPIRTYYKVDGYIAIAPQGNSSFKVTAVDIPDLETIIDDKGGKQTKIKEAIKEITGTTLNVPHDTPQVDAVTGATKYQKAVYTGFDALSSALITEMLKAPAWPKQNL